MKAKFDNVLLGFIIKSVFLSVVIVAFFIVKFAPFFANIAELFP